MKPSADGGRDVSPADFSGRVRDNRLVLFLRLADGRLRVVHDHRES